MKRSLIGITVVITVLVAVVAGAVRADPLPGEVLKFYQTPLDNGLVLLPPGGTVPSGSVPAPFPGHEGARQFFKLYVTAFPDLHFDIEQILPAGDSHVVVRWRSKGTHHGPLADIPATHRTASNHGCTLMEMKNGKAARAWVFFDNAHLLRQIGVLPVR